MEIAVISGKGGTGKSSISAAFAAIEKNIVLADCDVDAANMHVLFQPEIIDSQIYVSGSKAIINHKICVGCGLCSYYCRFGAISMKDERPVLDEISCDGCKLCSRVCPEEAITMMPSDQSRMHSGKFRFGEMVYGQLAPGEENSGKLVNMVREKARLIKKELALNTILIDGPPGIGCPVISSVSGVDKVLVVTEPSLSALHDLERVLSITAKFSIKTAVLVNKFDLEEAMSAKVENLCSKLQIPILGKLPYDSMVTEAMVNNQTIIEWMPDSAISLELYSIFKKIQTL